MHVTDRIVVITGAGAGIGAGLAREAATRGARAVAVVDADIDRARAVAGEVGGRAYLCDVSVHDEVASLADRITAELGVPGIVCANAGVNRRQPLVHLSPGDFEWIVGVNLRGIWSTCAVFGRLMSDAGEGWLLTTGSEHSLGVPHLGSGMYTATKHAVLGLSDVLRGELAGTVGVSVLCPGLVATQLWNSGRLRPDHLGGPIDPVPGAADLVSLGMDPALVAELAFDGIEREAFIIPTHPHARAYAANRWGEIADAFAHLASLGLDIANMDLTSLMDRQ
ncbi:MAG: SDR family NAD(P)-dependent oxidoreductase [Acidimicrobiales bacterium]